MLLRKIIFFMLLISLHLLFPSYTAMSEENSVIINGNLYPLESTSSTNDSSTQSIDIIWSETSTPSSSPSPNKLSNLGESSNFLFMFGILLLMILSLYFGFCCKFQTKK